MTASARANETPLRMRRWALLTVIALTAGQIVAGLGRPTSAAAQGRSLGPAQGPVPAALLPTAAVSSSPAGVITFGAASLFGGRVDVPLGRPTAGMAPTPGASGDGIALPWAPSSPPFNGTPFALSFDDCAPPAAINAILDALAQHHWLATFFPTGYCRDRYPWLVPTLLARGHLVCNHTYSHPFLTRLSDTAVAKEIEGGVHAGCNLFRPPYADWDGPRGRISRIANQHGYRVQLWDVDTRDWAGTSATMMVSMIRARGGMVLMHLSGPHTADAVRLL